VRARGSQPMRIAWVLVACLSGCISSARLYEGERCPRDEVAIITDSGCTTVILVVIDDHDRTDSDKVPHPWSSYTVEVLPGRHWVTVKWVSAWREKFSGAVLASEIAMSTFFIATGSLPVDFSGTRPVPGSYGSLQFSLYAKAGHKYRIRECEGPDRHASKAVERCWQYIGVATVAGGDAVEVWLVDETALREAGSE